MSRLFLAPLALTLLFAPALPLTTAAKAASFDCSKASTSFEKAICGNDGLSKEDEILAQAYATALGGLSTDAANEVKSAQKAWLDYAAKACSDDAKPISGTYTADQTQCLLSTFQSRVSSLEASKMQGGYRFYPIERYLVEADPDADADSSTKVGDKHFLTVKIDRTDDIAKAFNAWIDKDWTENQFSTGGDTPLFTKGTTDIAPGDPSTDVDYTETVKEVTSNRITLESSIYWYGHGAAHGNYVVSYDHFLIDKKRLLQGDDMFKAGWKDKFGKMVVDKTKAQLGDDYQGTEDKSVIDSATDPSRWDFSDQGLVVQFEPYEVAAYAAGAVTVTIPWDDLTDLLKDDAQTEVSY